MPRKKRQYSGRRQRKGRGGWKWLFALALIAVGGWIWWRHEPAKKPIPRPAATTTNVPTVTRRAQPLVPAHQASGDFPRPVENLLEAQIALARRVISPGSIDGVLGFQTQEAISVFQQSENLPVTGVLDTNTRSQLTLAAPLLTTYVVTTNDLARLQPLGSTWLAKSEQTALDYETELELVAEKSHSNPKLIRRLNPDADWTSVAPGTVLKIPDVNYPAPSDKAAFVVIHLDEKYLEAFGPETNLLAHFPCSIAAHVEKRPVGELRVIVIAPNPNYTVDPALFPESAELQAIGHKLIVPPGPNNPVGMVWIGLDKSGYGIHGTPVPQLVGRTESHGCFRLANWDAEYLEQLAWVGMPVFVEP